MTSPTLGTLRDRAKQRADMVGSSYVADAEWTNYINNAAAELHEMIVQGDQLSLQTTTDITCVSGTQIYALPAGFAKLIAAYWMDSTKPSYPLRRASMHEFGYQEGVEIAFVTGRPYAYNILSQSIWLFPLPNISGKVRVVYYPDFTALSSDSATFGWPIQASWVEFLDVTAAMMALAKEESSEAFQMLAMRKAELGAAIKKSIATKDGFTSLSVRDECGATARHRRIRLQV